ncbi:MAG TPA: YbaN family protein [Pelomicrobium sp.]|nr:YbaN family protein [Pelomicrobium sp.]
MSSEPLTEIPYRPHTSPTVRWLLIGAGTVCVVLGLIGVFMPVLPTTPFMLLAAACYARSSERFYRRLVGSPTFGPTILEWQRHRSIPYRTKGYAIVLMSATLATSIVFFVSNPYLKAALAALGVAVAVWLWRIPSRDRPPLS